MGSPALPDLEIYVAHVAEVMLHLRDEGHILSPIDQHLIEQWWEAGFPLDPVLRELSERGERLKNRKKPPRGLPLRSLDKYVRKAGESARTRSFAAPEATSPVVPAMQALTSVLAARSDHGPSRAALLELADLPEGLGAGESFALFLAASRRYYDACYEELDAAARDALRAQLLEQLGGAAARMAPDALEQTLAELVRRELRRSDPVLDPAVAWSAP